MSYLHSYTLRGRVISSYSPIVQTSYEVFDEEADVSFPRTSTVLTCETTKKRYCVAKGTTLCPHCEQHHKPKQD